VLSVMDMVVGLLCYGILVLLFIFKVILTTILMLMLFMRMGCVGK
jgi:hypothetical protein